MSVRTPGVSPHNEVVIDHASDLPNEDPAAVLVVLAGLPGTGKTTVAKMLAKRIRAAHLRTDVIAAPMLRSRLTEDPASAGRVAYDIACEVATETLQAGVPVVVDGVHASHALRSLWLGVSNEVGVPLIQLETRLKNEHEHRRRVELRQAGGYLGPTWQQIQEMNYEPWDDTLDSRRLIVDTSDSEAAITTCLADPYLIGFVRARSR